MADSQPTVLLDRHRHAVEAVKVSFEADLAAAPVHISDAPPFLNGCSAVWCKQILADGREWAVFVGLPPRFPDEVPRACVADWKDLFLKKPHIGNDGFICTIPDSASINSADPVGVVRHVFDDCEVILNGTGGGDFQEEFSSYWSRSCPAGNQGVLIVEPVQNQETPFSCILSNGLLVVASSPEGLSRWIARWTGKPPELKEVLTGVAIHLNAPLLPSEYPATLAQLVSIAEKNNPKAAARIKNLVADGTGSRLAILVQKQGDGVALGAVLFRGLGLATATIPGYRPGKAPIDLVFRHASKSIEGTNVMRCPVNRADHAWIHSRGGDGRDLSKKSVVVIGSGSLGGYVAQLLARTGIGRLTVTDNDQLGWGNLGRHALGAGYVGRSKAEAVAEELSRALPHLEIRGIPKDWRDIYEENPNFFNDYDLVVSTVADWRCERPLNELSRRTRMPPLCLGWLEPFAVAGHCLVIAPSGGCFECAANEHGQFNGVVAEFKTAIQLSKEPGSCTHYQHYGPIALMPVATMIASVVVESLLSDVSSSTHSIWTSSKEHFESVQAVPSAAWVSQVGQEPYSRIFKEIWNKSPLCAMCNPTHL